MPSSTTSSLDKPSKGPDEQTECSKNCVDADVIPHSLPSIAGKHVLLRLVLSFWNKVCYEILLSLRDTVIVMYEMSALTNCGIWMCDSGAVGRWGGLRTLK